MGGRTSAGRALCLWGAIVACDPEPEEDALARQCQRHTSEADCHAQVLEGESNDRCAWATRYEPSIGDECELGEIGNVCVHVAGEQAGCGPDVCTEDAEARVYTRMVGDRREVLRFDACGQQLVSDEWMNCAELPPSEGQALCACAC